MKKKQLQKLILAGLTCGLAVAAEANAQEGSSILLAGSGCGGHGGGCGSHTPSSQAQRGNGCSGSTRNQIADADEDQVINQKKGNGCSGSATPSNGCGARTNNNGNYRQGQ